MHIDDPYLRVSVINMERFWQQCIFLFITLKPRVEWYTKSMSLKYEPTSEPLHISVK